MGMGRLGAAGASSATVAVTGAGDAGCASTGWLLKAASAVAAARARAAKVVGRRAVVE